MPDDKDGREAQARNADRRQRQRDVEAELERMDEPEPPVAPEELEDLEADLGSVTFPAPAAAVVSAVGDREVGTADGTYAVAELLPESDAETFDAPGAVVERVQRPTVAAAMKRVVEASERLPDAELGRSQRDAYEKTFRALRAVTADDDDEGVGVIADWIVERIDEKEKLPGSRAVRREGAKYVRKNGYEVRNDEWLGV